MVEVQLSSIQDLMRIVEILARRYHHPGHAFLDVDALVGEGNEIICKIVREVRAGHGSTDTPWLRQALRTRFRQRVIDLRRAHCLSQRRGARVLQQSVLDARPGGFNMDSDIYHGSVDHAAITDALMDADTLFSSIQERLSDLDFYVFMLHFLEGHRAPEIGDDIDIPRRTIQGSIERIRRHIKEVNLSA